MASAEQPVLIAGGGIAGLGLALALARRGIASHILERRAEFSEAGAGIQLGPNGVRALAALGLDAEIVAVAGRPEAILVHDGASGRVLQRLPLGDWIEQRHGAPYLVAHRRDLQTVLLGAVRRQPLIRVTTGFELSGFETASGQLHARNANGDTLAGAALIGADGVTSVVRKQLHPTLALTLSGQTAARAVIPRDAVAADLDATVTGVWLAPDAHVVHYPVRTGSEIAVVVIRVEDWQQAGWSAPASRDDVLASIKGFAPRLVRALGAAPEWRRWALLEAPPLPYWSAGPVTLIGDAAHPVLPFLAQGGSLALEDAVTLAKALGAAKGDLPSAFGVWEQARRQRSAAVARLARRNGRIYHLGRPLASLRNLGLRLLPAERLMASYDWIYGWRGDE